MASKTYAVHTKKQGDTYQGDIAEIGATVTGASFDELVQAAEQAVGSFEFAEASRKRTKRTRTKRVRPAHREAS